MTNEGETASASLDHWKLLLEQVETRMATQRDEWDELDRKGATVIATTGVVFGLVVDNASRFVAAPQPGGLLFAAALAALLGGLGAGLAALWPRRLSVVPLPRRLLDEYQSASTKHVVGVLARTQASAYDTNLRLLERKTSDVRRQIAALLIASVLLVGGLILTGGTAPGQDMPVPSPAPLLPGAAPSPSPSTSTAPAPPSPTTRPTLPGPDPSLIGIGYPDSTSVERSDDQRDQLRVSPRTRSRS